MAEKEANHRRALEISISAESLADMKSAQEFCNLAKAYLELRELSYLLLNSRTDREESAIRKQLRQLL